MSRLGFLKSLPNHMKLITLKGMMFAAFGAVMGALSGLLIILPLAGAIQAPALDTLPSAAPRSMKASFNLPAELAPEPSSIPEDSPLADPEVETASGEPPFSRAPFSRADFS